ncbi:hypothetical protein [Siccirubricoccus phaeus]|uniref:hypothetical protein n=1 Tax=Siccirubricoccus phaeus TaxID=2595053 RepID=UPI0011F0FEF3|nr:hypothetical protein [Siccirubricoccus phaeus]
MRRRLPSAFPIARFGRRGALLALWLWAKPAGAETPPRAPPPEEWQNRLDRWWDRQREKEAADRFWNGPREARRNLTRDQIERWEADRDRRLRRPRYPF